MATRLLKESGQPIAEQIASAESSRGALTSAETKHSSKTR